MTTYSLIDSTGELIGIANVDDIASNTPIGATSVEGYPPDINSYRLNNTWVTKPIQPSHIHTWNKTTKVWEDARTIDEIRNLKWEQIKQWRATAIATNLTTPYGIFQCRDEDRQNIIDSVLLANNLTTLGLPVAIEWTLADNSIVTLDQTQMVTVGLLLGQQVQTAHARARVLRIAKDTATTISEIEALTW
jgi:hypothetical protein